MRLYTLGRAAAFGAVYARLFGSGGLGDGAWRLLALPGGKPRLGRHGARGLAFALFLLALAVFLRLQPDSDWKLPALAGWFSGLTVLSHLGYAYFLALWMGVWLLFRRSLWKQAAVDGWPSRPDRPALDGGSARQSSLPGLPERPAFAQHAGCFLRARQPAGDDFDCVDWVQQTVRDSAAGMAGSGRGRLATHSTAIRIACFAGRNIPVQPAKLGVSSFVLGIWLTVGLLQQTYEALESRRWGRKAVILVSALLVLTLFSAGMSRIAAMKPSLTRNLLEAAEYMQKNTPAESNYIILADYGEAEWFPYLSKRIPIFAHWAYEWQGNIQEQSGFLLDSFACGQAGDLECIQRIIRAVGREPQYLVVMKRKYRPFLDALETTRGWRRVYNNPEYQVWEKRE